MDERIEEITRKLDKILSILDAKSKKLLSDRERIKAKRDDDAAQTAKTRGVIVVDRLTGTFARDDRLPYHKWALVCLEFDSALDFLRWVVHEYLGSYHCQQDSRKRMIARNGNYWKCYKSCGSEMFLTPVDMFGGANMRWDTMLDVQMLKWCFKHIKPVLEYLVNDDRLEFVHEKQMPWDDEKVNVECGPPMPLEPRWWRKSTRFQETMMACIAPYGRGYVRTNRGSMLIDVDQTVLERPETQALFHSIYEALREGVMNRAAHDDWMERKQLHVRVDRAEKAWRVVHKQTVAENFMKKLKQDNAIRLGMAMAARAKEECDMQAAIELSIKEV